LKGLTVNDTKLFFKKLKIQSSNEQIIEFNKAVGGHPMALVFIKNLLENGEYRPEDFKELSQESIEKIFEWLFKKIFSTLNSSEKGIILRMSIFNYPFNDNEALEVIEVIERPRYLFMPLYQKNLITKLGSEFVIHDCIRPVAYDILTNSEKNRLHNKMVNFYKKEMEIDYKTNHEVSYVKIFKWGYHLENVDSGECLSPLVIKLKRMDEKYLDALWAIRRFGYPFSFADKKLKQCNSIIRELVKCEQIEKNTQKLNKKSEKIPEYVLKNFNFFDELFVVHLCLSKNVSNHLGYIKNTNPNFAYSKQNLLCPWEHCIELFPLPSDEFEKMSESIKLNLVDIDGNILMKDAWAFIKASSCPIFGHSCPNGPEQANFCKNED
jgi:hypothetical protein